MITIDKIDFTKLKPYDGETTKCFEQLCYQIAQKEFGHLGTFTPINGSGGDGGVEFYLKLQNGEKWGWQCKFFGDTGRLNSGKRKTQIADSLETAIRNHNDLTKWFLCIKTDLTTDSLSSKGKFSQGERSWFENELTKKIPAGKTIALEHWGESSFITFLKDSKHIGIRSFFFGELEFNQDWFKQKFDENFEKVKDKYDPDLHTIDKYTQSIIDFFLFDPNYIKLTGNLREELLKKSNAIEAALDDFLNERMLTPKEHCLRENYFLICQEFNKHIDYVFEKINFVESCFVNNTPELLLSFSLKELNENFQEFFSKIDCNIFDEKTRAFDESLSISDLISGFNKIYNRFFYNYFHDRQRELHFIANAAKGKTHLSCDIAYKKIATSKPAIFITGDKFTNETSIKEAFIKILDIPREFTFDNFLQALDIYASIIKIQIPLIVDGLNETISNRLFSPIWKNHLSAFISTVLQTKNLIIITTCRNSYIDRIWETASKNKFHYLDGFDDYETIHEVVKKYFTKYKLKADLFFASLEKFRDPIFLKIFCEIKNPNWKYSEEIAVSLEEEFSFDIFNTYLKQVNDRVIKQYHFIRKGSSFIENSLKTISKYLWDNNTREIPIEAYYQLIDCNEPYDEDTSKAEVLKKESLIVDIDNRGEYEFVTFTYQVLSGYLIADYLLSNHNPEYFLSAEFEQKMYSEEFQHPLYDDILLSLVFALPKIKGVKFHDIITNIETEYQKDLFSLSIASLFKLPPNLINNKDIQLIENLFKKSIENKRAFFEDSFKTLGDINHPLNGVFLSNLLASLKMNERDISWTEFVREKSHDLEELILEFETQCRSYLIESKLVSEKQHIISRVIVWFLTSTNRSLRDKATKALYFYGRKFPNEFISILWDSLKSNDPYVWERTLAAMYGVTMAEHNSIKSDNFRNQILPELSIKIYELIFKEDAPHSTTHILARDYARRIIEISLIYHLNLLPESEIKNIRPPYTFGGIRDWGEYEYGKHDYSHNGPIHMDFSNYTIGRIVKDGHSYSNPPEKKKVRRQIYWRVFNLGWDAETFKEVEKALGNDNYYSKGSTEQAKVERYGKKYSWIAYYENAGLRDDLGLLKNWDDFRLSDADIDPSFPENPKNEIFFTHSLLGDKTTPLIDWYENSGMPFVEEYLNVKDLNGNNGEWICLDSFINQEDILAGRNCFTHICGLIIKDNDYSEVIKLINTQSTNREYLPDQRENYHIFAGELYYCNEATHDNLTALEFEIGRKKNKIKKGDPGYYPSVFFDTESDSITIRQEFPEEIEIEVSEIKKFEVLLPVMKYNWEKHHSSTNNTVYMTVVGKEIAQYLNLITQPQTFDLLDNNGNIASKNIMFYNDYDNNHTFIYLRKDLLDKYLMETKSKFIWVIWGERDVRFKTEEKRQEFFESNPFKNYQVFQKLIEYEKL